MLADLWVVTGSDETFSVGADDYEVDDGALIFWANGRGGKRREVGRILEGEWKSVVLSTETEGDEDA